MKATRSFWGLVALVLALAALGATAGSAQATGGKGSDKGKKEKSEKVSGQAKANVDAAAKAQAKAAAKATQQAETAAKAQAKVAAKTQVKTQAKTQATASQQSSVTVTGSAPNQGEASKVLTVNGMACANPVAGTKVEGNLGTTINLSSTVAIAKVTVKSGQDAAVVSSSFAGDFKSGTITLSKDVSNYIVWTCGAAPTVQTNVETGKNDTQKGKDDKSETQTDVCPNIEGMQTSVPAGTEKQGNGACVETKAAASAQPTVVAGVQTPETKAQGQAMGQAKGQAAPPGQAQPTSGVLGATASAPEQIEETGTANTLPFTGIPLWVAALLGVGLLLTGLMLRRAGQH